MAARQPVTQPFLTGEVSFTTDLSVVGAIALGTHVGRGRRVSGVRIAVYVAALDERPPLQLSAELDAVSWVPLASLVPVTARVAELPDDDVPAYALELPGAETLVVWGITYAILERLRALAA